MASQTRSELDVVLNFAAHQKHFELHMWLHCRRLKHHRHHHQLISLSMDQAETRTRTVLRAQASDQNKVCSLSVSQLQLMATGTQSSLVDLSVRSSTANRRHDKPQIH